MCNIYLSLSYKLKEKVKSIYGCVAPWFKTRNNLTCESDIPIKPINDATLDDLLNYYMRLQNLDMFTFEPAACPKPCTTLNIYIKTLNEGYSKVSGSYLEI